ncbi:MAG: preprotein translocase subunit SecG [Pyrinomonadaceae bacterium]
MIYVLYGIFILACIILVIAVLLQPGKADAGALFSGSVNSTAFGARGTATLLQKITVGSAISFFLIALLMSLPAVTGSRSLLQSTPDAGPGPTPVPAATPAPPAPGAPVPAAPTTAPAANPAAPTTVQPATSPAASPATKPANSPAAKPAPKKPGK